MPASQRPDERALASGTQVLSDAELIAVILRTGTVGKSSLELANEVLALDRGKSGLSNFACCDFSDFITIRGLGRVKALKLACICELSRRLSASHTERWHVLDTPDKAAEYMMETVRHLDHEEVHILLSDAHNRAIRSVQIAKGSLCSASLSAREIIKTALRFDAAGFILVHNHPSGICEPSSEDIAFSKNLQEAGRLMDIRMNDSIIIGDGTFTSLRQRGFL